MPATTLAAALQALVSAGPSVLGPLATHLNGSSQMTQSASALLVQAQLNPSMAASIAAQIAAIPGVPAGVLAYVNELGTLASDKIAYSAAIAQAQAALTAATSTGTLGNILGNLL
jgi:hypothetical protein